MIKSVNRRTLLKSAFASIALPWLEIMGLPGEKSSFAPHDDGGGSSNSGSPKRLAFMYIPNGVIGKHWFPTEGGVGFELPQTLKPLEPHLEHLSVISGLNRTYLAGEPHSQAASCWLTSSPPNERLDGRTAINRTLDQVIANEVGNETVLRSLELSCNRFLDSKEPKIFDAISWYGPGVEARSDNQPERVFRKLFGKPADLNQSVLDSVTPDALDLRKRLGVADRQKLEEYLTSIRMIEQRIERRRAQAEFRKEDLHGFQFPESIPTNRGEFIQLMGDLMVMAFRTDQTRIASLMIGPERWETPQLYEGVFEKPVNHHVMTHDLTSEEDVARIDRFHVQQFAYVLDKLRNIQEGEHTLLDQCSLVLGSGLGNGAQHSYEQLPIIVAGGGATGSAHGRHIECAKGTPLANLWLGLAEWMGVRLPRFADSTEPLRLS